MSKKKFTFSRIANGADRQMSQKPHYQKPMPRAWLGPSTAPLLLHASIVIKQ